MIHNRKEKGTPLWRPVPCILSWFPIAYLCTERNSAEVRLLVDAIVILVLDRLVRRGRHLDVAIEYGIGGELQISRNKSHFIPIVLRFGRSEDLVCCCCCWACYVAGWYYGSVMDSIGNN